MQRIGRLLQASMFLNYMWQKMRVAGAPSRWGSNCVWCNAINTVPWQLESGNYFIFNCDVNGRNIESLKQMIRNIRKECAQVIFPVCLFRQVRQVLDFPRFPHASLSFSPGLNITEDSQKHTQCCVYSVSRCRFSFWQTGRGSNVTVKYAIDRVEVASTTQRLWLCFGGVCYRTAFSSVLKINQACCHIFLFWMKLWLTMIYKDDI